MRGPPHVPPSHSKRARARARFYRLVNHFTVLDAAAGQPYKRATLIRLTYEYAREGESQDSFLRAFFGSLQLPVDGQEEGELDDQDLERDFVGFADLLIDDFFLPMKASTNKTPQPSPAFHSAIERDQNSDEFVGTENRLAALRGDCLVRDQHRCVISRKFDRPTAIRRIDLLGDDARDDEGRLEDIRREEHAPFDTLQVAHILPHALTKADAGSDLTDAQKTAISILNFFDHGVAHLVNGTEIDRPQNALSMSPELHIYFGQFQVFFKATDQPDTYRIDSNLKPIVKDEIFPVTRTILLTETQTIEPPSPRLLAVHYAISQILHLSAAGAYIDEILRVNEENAVRADGSTELGRLVQLGLGGWLGQAV